MSGGPRELNWFLFNLFNDRPGTPKTVRCVGCKLALGASSIGLGAILLGLGKRKGVKNVYVGTTLGILGVGSILLSGIFFRVAYENKLYNDQLFKDIRQKKIERWEESKKKQQLTT